MKTELKYWTYGKGGIAHYSNSLTLTKLKAVWFCLKYNKPSYVEKPTGEPDNSYKNIKTYNLRKLRKIILFLKLVFYLPLFIILISCWTLIISIVWFLDRKTPYPNLIKELRPIIKYCLKGQDFFFFFLSLCLWFFGMILLFLGGFQ